jgi:hypothetical protein
VNDIDGDYHRTVVVVSTQRTILRRTDPRTAFIESVSAGRRLRRPNLRMGVVVASALYVLTLPLPATAQEANMSTTVASLGSGTTSLITLDAVKPKPATDHGLTLPSVTLIDDGSGPRVKNLVLKLPDLDLGNVAVASRVGDQPLPAVFRAAPLAGPGLASSMRGVTFTTAGIAPLSLSFGQMGTMSAMGTPKPGSPALAAAAVSFTPNSRFSMTPQVLFPVGSRDSQTSVGTAIQTNVVSNLSLLTDVGVAGTATTAWAPSASARLVGQWPHAGIETSVLRGAPTPGTSTTNTAIVSSRDREAAQAQLQPISGLTLTALTSASRPAADPAAADTLLSSFRVAYAGFPSGQLAAAQQRETTGSRDSDLTSLEWRQSGQGRMAVRYVQQRISDSALDGIDDESSRVELDLPTLTPQYAGRLDLRAALTAGSSSLTGPAVNSRVSGRVGLIDGAALTGETEFGITGGDGHALRAFRVMTDMPVVPATRLQLSYTYRTSPQFPIGQAFEARILRRLDLGW